MNIRLIEESDIEDITKIYNQIIETKISTAHVTPVTAKDRMAWYQDHKSSRYPIYVAEIDNKVIGWILLSPYRKGREALKCTAEISYFIHQKYQRKGIGTKLVAYILKKSKELNFKNLFAIVLERNIGSIILLKKFDFVQWGFLPNVAEFDNIPCGQFYFGLNI